MAQQQGLLTITGYVGGQPTQFNREGMPHASSFRLASTRHYFDGRTQQWKDLPTTWITVKAYRGLSESICQSFKKGEPVFRCVKRLFIIDEMALWIIRTAPKCFSGSRTLSGHPRNQPSSALRTYPCSIWFDNGVVFCANLFYMSCFLFI